MGVHAPPALEATTTKPPNFLRNSSSWRQQRVAKVQQKAFAIWKAGWTKTMLFTKNWLPKFKDVRRVGLVDANNPNLIADFNCDMFCQEIRSKTIPQAIWLYLRTPPPTSSVGTPWQSPQSSLPTGCANGRTHRLPTCQVTISFK